MSNVSLRRRSCGLLAVAALVAAAGAQGLAAQDRTITYQLPPQTVVDLVDAPVTPGTSLSPDRTVLLLLDRPALPSIAELAEPELRLGGVRVNPRTNGSSRMRPLEGLRLVGIADGAERPVTGLPADARIGNVRWSPDGRRIAFTHTADDRVELWVADVATARAERLTDVRVNEAAFGAAVVWHPDSRSLFVRTVPPERGPAPERRRVPVGPVVQENLGRVAPARTYQDLLEDAHDEALFDHYFTSRIVRVSLDGRVRPLGDAGVYTALEPSPDGRFLLVNRIERPYSYLVPASRFPLTTEVWDEDGRVAHVVAKRPLAEEVPIGFDAVLDGPRSIGWRHDAPATLVWVEAQDGGDPRADAEIRDRVFVLDAPFGGEPAELAALERRLGGILWGDDDLAVLYEAWFTTRLERAWALKPGSPGADPRLLYERSAEDRYNDPGRPLTVPNEAGQPVLFTADDGRSLFLRGAGASPEGDRPFVDRYDLATGETKRLWRSEPPYFESVLALLDGEGRRVLTTRESTDVQPNLYIRDLASGELEQLTRFPHPMPALRGVYREMITYEREDGLPLSGTLYLPVGYDADRDGPMPLMVWAYPREFLSADAAGQITDSPHRFNRIGYWGPHFLVTQGYAVLDNATMPVVGEDGEEPNDTFVEQLVANAAAAIDAVVARGVADPDRVAVGGHSYGAFMTANLLAHSDLFRAGIARSGAYNRSLTPFGFQREQRTIWEATDVYIAMSPFFHAHRIRAPILLIHGDADNNSGTFPIQSERLYHALRGLGGTARLVVLPHESHGYQARESVLHMLWETLTWLDTYVKDAPRRDVAADQP